MAVIQRLRSRCVGSNGLQNFTMVTITKWIKMTAWYFKTNSRQSYIVLLKLNDKILPAGLGGTLVSTCIARFAVIPKSKVSRVENVAPWSLVPIGWTSLFSSGHRGESPLSNCHGWMDLWTLELWTASKRYYTAKRRILFTALRIWKIQHGYLHSSDIVVRDEPVRITIMWWRSFQIVIPDNLDYYAQNASLWFSAYSGYICKLKWNYNSKDGL